MNLARKRKRTDAKLDHARRSRSECTRQPPQEKKSKIEGELIAVVISILVVYICPFAAVSTPNYKKRSIQNILDLSL
jgi:hypothetical protein